MFLSKIFFNKLISNIFIFPQPILKRCFFSTFYSLFRKFRPLVAYFPMPYSPPFRPVFNHSSKHSPAPLSHHNFHPDTIKKHKICY